jgi:hypothetical protein
VPEPVSRQPRTQPMNDTRPGDAKHADRRRAGHDRRPKIAFDVTYDPAGGTRREVPFCTAPELVRAVVLERRSVLGRVLVDANSMRSMTTPPVRQPSAVPRAL